MFGASFYKKSVDFIFTCAILDSDLNTTLEVNMECFYAKCSFSVGGQWFAKPTETYVMADGKESALEKFKAAHSVIISKNHNLKIIAPAEIGYVEPFYQGNPGPEFIR